MRESALLRLLQPDVYSLECHALVQKYDIYRKTFFLYFPTNFSKTLNLKMCVLIFLRI